AISRPFSTYSFSMSLPLERAFGYAPKYLLLEKGVEHNDGQSGDDKRAQYCRPVAAVLAEERIRGEQQRVLFIVGYDYERQEKVVPHPEDVRDAHRGGDGLE